ncbi:hypothetical protein SDC9_105491 [bioreactor metagenome]|uniref:Uncharacterized protein n=1 Tax=bioreactor metagenome TaxID=1076179 RepID=A0A645AZT6_9ZZZZ
MHSLDSKPAKRGIDFLGGYGSCRKTEGFGQAYTNRGSDLYDNLLLGIGGRREERCNLILLIDGSNWAVSGTLAAAYTGAVFELEHGGGSHTGLIPPSDELKGEDTLQVLTDLYTASALDALLRLQDDGSRRGVLIAIAETDFEGLLADTELCSKVLQLTLTIADAGEAAGGVG